MKVHGYRVELGEVEAALATLPELSQVAAAMRIDARGRRRLVAYYVAPAPHDPAVLRKALASRLPLYMVPDGWMWLRSLPRTHTGKLDRAALPAPPVVEALGPAAPPATAVEAIVASVWQQVLHLPSVGRHDNFFDLGGDSIQSILVASHLTQRGFRLSAREMFAHQTVAELAQVVERVEPPPAD